MTIIVLLAAHWTLAAFVQSSFHHRYASHRMFSLTPRSTFSRASALNRTDFAAIARSSYASGSTTQPREAGRSPSSVVASGTRGEHARRPITVAHEPPRLAPASLIERMGMANLGRNRCATMRTDRAKERVTFRPNGAALGRHSVLVQ